MIKNEFPHLKTPVNFSAESGIMAGKATVASKKNRKPILEAIDLTTPSGGNNKNYLGRSKD